jgi:hypothetical protein
MSLRSEIFWPIDSLEAFVSRSILHNVSFACTHGEEDGLSPFIMTLFVGCERIAQSSTAANVETLAATRHVCDPYRSPSKGVLES